MRTIFVVKPEEADKARRMEKTLLNLPTETGILFVSASVISHPDTAQTPDRRPLYKIVVGCTRARDVQLISHIVRTYLQDEIESDSQLIIEVHRGVDKTTLQLDNTHT